MKSSRDAEITINNSLMSAWCYYDGNPGLFYFCGAINEMRHKVSESDKLAILVPGWTGIHARPGVMKDFLSKYGYDSLCFKLSGMGMGDIGAYADELGGFIADRSSPESKVLLVGHSMGGLIARAALTEGDCGRVHGYVSMGTPHSGSRLGSLPAPIKSTKQMAWQSEFIRELNNKPWPESVPALALMAERDLLVLPSSSASIPFGGSVIVPGTNHLTVAYSQYSLDIIGRFVKGLS